MLYFTLPNFFEYSKINNYLIFQTQKNSKIFKEPIVITKQSGSFPYFYWNGGINNNIGPGIYYQDLINSLGLSTVPIRINCSNIFLEQNDFNNVFCNLVLSFYNTGSNQIEVTNLELLSHIDKRYQNFRFVFSNNSNILTKLTPQIINQLFDNIDKLDYVISYDQDSKFFQEIKHLDKIEIIVNPICPKTCSNKTDCLIAENNSQLNFSEKSCFLNCTKVLPFYENNECLTIDKIKEKYVPLGITHFSLQQMPINNMQYLLFLSQYFIKSEYQIDFLNKFYYMEN